MLMQLRTEGSDARDLSRPYLRNYCANTKASRPELQIRPVLTTSVTLADRIVGRVAPATLFCGAER